MTKAELIDAVAARTGESKAETAKTIDALTAVVRGADKVTLVGFGTFAVKAKPARVGRNPQTGEAIQIAAKRVLSFKASKL